MSPKITAIVTHYDQQEWLPRAMASIAAQTAMPYEVIFVDDGSDDPPPLSGLRSHDLPRLTAVYGDHQGTGAALNRAARIMRGDVFCWLPADDEWLPNKLMQQAAFARVNPACVLHSNCHVFLEDRFDRVGEVPALSDCEFASAICTSSPYYASTFWIPKTVMDSVGPFREDVVASEDYDWVLRSVLLHKIRYRLQPECLVVKRLHAGQASKRHAADIPALMQQFNRELA